MQDNNKGKYEILPPLWQVPPRPSPPVLQCASHHPDSVLQPVSFPYHQPEMARTQRQAHDILKFKELPNDFFSLIRVPLFGFRGSSSSIGMSLHRLFQKPLARVSISHTSSAAVEISFSGGHPVRA
uniref:Uncharacterized protein n=1 Tax=Meloidogyne enterolobii TaxID=390850 RepID=A0A6V7WQT3_MELEN|nr:unnamed protein product [Meloidogyne enterolobii]